MKPSRFKINTDYATLKNDASGSLSVVIPDSITLSANSPNRVYRATGQFGKSSAGWATIWKSDKYDYALCGASVQLAGKQDGYDAFVIANVSREGANYVLEVTIPSSAWGSTTYTGLGQTLTAEIHSFIDPLADL